MAQLLDIISCKPNGFSKRRIRKLTPSASLGGEGDARESEELTEDPAKRTEDDADALSCTEAPPGFGDDEI